MVEMAAPVQAPVAEPRLETISIVEDITFVPTHSLPFYTPTFTGLYRPRFISFTGQLSLTVPPATASVSVQIFGTNQAPSPWNAIENISLPVPYTWSSTEYFTVTYSTEVGDDYSQVSAFSGRGFVLGLPMVWLSGYCNMSIEFGLAGAGDYNCYINRGIFQFELLTPGADDDGGDGAQALYLLGGQG